MMTQLSEKLRALGVNLGTSSLPARPELTKHKCTLPEMLPGDYTRQGTLFETEQIFGFEYRHGLHPLWLTAYERLSQLTDQLLRLQDMVFLDAETTGLSGGTGTFAFMIGLGWFNDVNSFTVRQLFLPEPGAEFDFLTALAERMANFTTVVSFNGKSFDIPLLNSRYILHRLPSPFRDLIHIDLLHLSRSIWRYLLPSRTLSELEDNILHFTRSEQELPGWMAPKLYLDYLQTGDASPLKGMFYHNQIDIVSLAALLTAIENSLAFHVETPLELFALAELYEKNGDSQRAVKAYQEINLRDPGPFLAAQARFRLGMLERRTENWQNAIAHWQEAATHHPDACVELAKYYEHQTGEVENAARWCQMALEIIRNKSVPDSIRISVSQTELQYRLDRLERKSRRKEEDHDN